VLTRLRVQNFKRLHNVAIELGQTVVFIGPNNSGKSSALQAIWLWRHALSRIVLPFLDSGQKSFDSVALNRLDFTALPIPAADLLWTSKYFTDKSRSIWIELSGVSLAERWDCSVEIAYANPESVLCRVRASDDSLLPYSETIELLPSMSGLVAHEDLLQPGSIQVRLGEGRTAEVLRNLCFNLQQTRPLEWEALTQQMQKLFGSKLDLPNYNQSRGQLTMSYEEHGATLDLSCAGRGFHQTLLLLTHLYSYPQSVLLLDEPDAHLEILRQRQIYEVLNEVAGSTASQLIIASHSEVLLNEAAGRDVVVAFVGAPHRIDSRSSQVAKSLRSIGFEHYYQAELQGWILYLEGSTDLAMLRAFALRLNHPALPLLDKPFVHYVGNDRSKVADHFYGLREAKPDLVCIALFDSDTWTPVTLPERVEMMWSKSEFENYLCSEQTLIAFAESGEPQKESERRVTAMRASIDEITTALKTLGKPGPFSSAIKASDEVLGPLFHNYFARLDLPNSMLKSDFHSLVRFVPAEQLHPEITQKLDQIVAMARLARPRTE
jgi:energy-coupling factor transporter ATP-binding protein EcfA2